MADQHTRGPWRDAGGIGHGSWIVGADAERVENVAVVYSRASRVGMANATLIAAAPELLAALELAESFMAGFEDDEVQEGINERLAAIRAVIAKARGAA